jgi:hypothetical protein
MPESMDPLTADSYNAANTHFNPQLQRDSASTVPY